jgi:hypothetical protein
MNFHHCSDMICPHHVKTVRTCQNLLGQNGTHLGLLLLLVGPNGDGFGGQAFMEHYNAPHPL